MSLGKAYRKIAQHEKKRKVDLKWKDLKKSNQQKNYGKTATTD